MTSNTDAPAVRTPGRSPSGTLMERIAALVEVLVAFVVVHVSYRSFKHFTELGRLEGSTGLNFSVGSMMILFTVVVLLLFRRNFQEYGLTLKEWRYNLNVGLFWGVLVVAGGAVIVKFAPIHFDPLHPPDMTRALVFAAGELVATFFLVWFLMREKRWLRRIPGLVSLLVLIGFLSLPLALTWYASGPFLNKPLNEPLGILRCGVRRRNLFSRLHSVTSQSGV